MKVTFADKSIAWLALLSGLAISAVAVYYSVAGLISIFAAAAIPIAVMGIVLELSKLVATVWLKQNWFIAPRLIKAYLLIAVAILMLITSMGIFGYLSKAHLDQAVPTGDVAAQVALLDEKIKTERDNIDASKKALTQMDAQVDQMLGRSDTERGAERAVQIRKNQAKERASLQADIAKSQKAIAGFNQERAPIAAELRKVEAEVGPIKYIAALLYGDNPDQNVLERAVRWVIILIVIIFDPLAVVLLLASQYSFQYFRKQKEEEDANINAEFNSVHVVGDGSGAVPVVATGNPQEEITHCPKCGTEIMNAPGIGEFCPNKECDVVDNLFGTGDPEVDAFFKRVKVIAKLQDIEDEQADIDEANALIAEISKEEDELEEMASDLAELAQITEIENNAIEPEEKPWPFPMWRPLEGDGKLEQDIIDSMPVLENEELWASRVIDENDEEDETEAKRNWKLLNPHDTIKRQRNLYERGLISQLPWETIEQFDSEREEEEIERLALEVDPLTPDYEADDGPLAEDQLEQIQQSVEDSKKKELHNEATESTNKEEAVNYVQNSEQGSGSIWKRIQERKS
jgi:hypothetical protein